tara:strand:+ start:112 stop:636 length:525 start_codon:yes stop_codon:yes gene_type:complete
MPKILKKSSLYKSKLFNINEAKIEFHNETLTYEIISGTGSGAVLIIPIIDNKIIFIKEYAAAVDDYMLTLPKGKIDSNETIYQAADRELQEEIGFKSNKMKFIKEIYLAPGYIDHVTYMMLAESLKPSSLIGDEPEDLEIIQVEIPRISTFLEKNKIIDSRVYAAVNYIQNNYE